MLKTRCKSQGKCCKMVIDTGSTNNLVSTKMVEKMGLKRMKHTTPYKVSWLQKGHHLLVNEQCNVKFQIGTYKDVVLCDIMPIDVCAIYSEGGHGNMTENMFMMEEITLILSKSMGRGIHCHHWKMKHLR